MKGSVPFGEGSSLKAMIDCQCRMLKDIGKGDAIEWQRLKKSFLNAQRALERLRVSLAENKEVYNGNNGRN